MPENKLEKSINALNQTLRDEQKAQRQSKDKGQQGSMAGLLKQPGVAAPAGLATQGMARASLKGAKGIMGGIGGVAGGLAAATGLKGLFGKIGGLTKKKGTDEDKTIVKLYKLFSGYAAGKKGLQIVWKGAKPVFGAIGKQLEKDAQLTIDLMKNRGKKDDEAQEEQKETNKFLSGLDKVLDKKGKAWAADSPQGKMILTKGGTKDIDKANQTRFLQSIAINSEKTLEALLGNTLAEEEARREAEAKAKLTKGKEKGKGGGAAAGGDGLDPPDAKKKGFLSKVLGGAAKFASSGGMLLAGIGALMGGGGYLLKQFNEFDGEKFKKNVKAVFSIKDEVTDSKSILAFAGDVAKDSLFALSMFAVGAGVAAFALGAGVAGTIDKFVTLDAQGIKDNVRTLMSISDIFGEGWAGTAAFLVEGAVFGASMAAIGAGLGVFGVGAGAAEAITKFSGDGSWIDKIKANVVKLLSISDIFGGGWAGKAAFVGEGAVFGVTMAAIGGGLALFGIGAAVAGAADGAHQAINKFTELGWAESIVQNVKTLLSIANIEGIGWDTAIFIGVMGGISAGLLAFAVGETASGLATVVSRFSEAGTGESWTSRIHKNVSELLAITADKNISKEKAADFSETMGLMAKGLLKFSGSTFISGLLDGATAVLSFITGSKSPVEQMTSLADKHESLTKGADALDRLRVSLGSISNLRLGSGNIGIKKFSQDLLESVPLIEAAIMGSDSVDGGLLDKIYPKWLLGDKSWKGLASADIDYAGASANLQSIFGALPGGGSINLSPAQQSRDLTGTGGAGGSNIISADNNSSSTTITYVESPSEYTDLDHRILSRTLDLNFH